MNRIEVLRQMNGSMLVTANGSVVEIGPDDDRKVKLAELSDKSGVPAHLIEVHITRMELT